MGHQADRQRGRQGATTIQLPGQARGELRDSIDVVNRSDRPLRLGIYAADAFTTQEGGLDLLTTDKDSVDVGSWVTLDRKRIVVPPRGTVSVPFTLVVPDNATPGDHTGGIVTSLVTKTDTGVGVDRRMGTRIYIRVDGSWSRRWRSAASVWLTTGPPRHGAPGMLMCATP